MALGPLVVEAARNSLIFKYAHLPYLYTLFYKVHRHGGTVLRPLFFEFAADLTAGHIDTQFMWGSALMVAPALQLGEQQTKVYFPLGTWFHAINYTRIDSEGQFVSQFASFQEPNVYYRAGQIVPTQSPELTTDQTRSGNFTLVVVLQNENSNAAGKLYWDSGDGLDTEELGRYNLYQFKVNNVRRTVHLHAINSNHFFFDSMQRVLQIESHYLGYPTEQKLDELVILGLHSMPNEIIVDGLPANFTWSQQTRVAHVRKLNLSLFSAQNSLQYQVEWKM